MVFNLKVRSWARPLVTMVLVLVGLVMAGCGRLTAGSANGIPDSYYHFLRSHYEELQAQDELAIKSIEKAVAAASGSFYLNLEAAKLLTRSGRVNEANKYVAKALELEPDNVDTRLFAAWLAAGTGQWEEAENHYLKVLKVAPQNEEALSYLGALYAESGRIPEAYQTFLELGASAPASYLPDYYLGLLAEKRNQSELAIEHFQLSLQKNPDFAAALTELAFVYEQTGKIKDAEKTYRRLIKIRPEASVPKARLSRILLKSGRRNEAVSLLKEIGEMASGSVHAGIMVGLAYLEESMYVEAEKEFRQLQSQFPDNEQLPYLLATVRYEQGDIEQAKQFLRSIKPSNRQYVDSRLFLCSILIEEGKTDDAIAVLVEARSRAAWSPQLVLAQATMLEEQDRFKEAKAIYVDSLKTFPEVAELRFRLGFVEDKLGDKQACITSMKKAIELDPNHAEALNYLAYTWAKKGENLTEALAMALKADSLKPDNGYIVDTVAWIYYGMGDLKKSVPLLEKAVRLSEDNPEILEHLGDALNKVGRKAEARKAYSRAVEKGHESPGVIHEKLKNIK
ncbi:MAG: tetratricopeptide repeat protein [Deltaproteobacteria bacterium]|jgi:tetratricopeptide (TPR) repeat protein|nr:tetratricopeptide repeat protein [Deltaproteobacteria bacterium]